MTSTVDPSREQAGTGLVVRPARPADAEAVAGLLVTAADLAQVSPDETHPLTPETVRHWIEKRRAGYVLEQRRNIVGYAELVDDARDSDRVWIGHMMVSPAQRGLGLGRKLVDALLHIAEHDRDVSEVAISAFEDNERAQRCYRGCGFRDRATHRVKDRRLIEMRYRVPGRRPLVPVPVVMTILTLAAALVIALAGPSTWQPVLVIPVVTTVVLAAWALHPLLPLRRDLGVRRVLRALGYSFAVGSSAVLVTALLGLVTDVDLLQAIRLAAGASVLAGAALVVHTQLVDRKRSANA